MSATDQVEREKRIAAEAAAELVQDGMLVGLGTGSTAAYLLGPLAARKLDIRCVATSPSTAQAARAMGIDVVSFAGLEAPAQLDIVIDGADQVDPSGWLIKGGGGAHTREKAVAAATDRFVVIVSANKLVQRLTPPVPLELAEFGLAGTLARLAGAELRGMTVAQVGLVKVRDASHSPDGGVIADYMTPFEDPHQLAEWLSEMPGIVEHGLFPPSMVSEVVVGRDDGVERIPVAH
ncbi:MAG TPA: ribose 5-phosphate isomerase A [Solirubrobacteraceae bacterium]|nr:ribose 5-phosphate isomerase A [Solirubrobacteraceae bacterium]